RPMGAAECARQIEASRAVALSPNTGVRHKAKIHCAAFQGMREVAQVGAPVPEMHVLHFRDRLRAVRPGERHARETRDHLSMAEGRLVHLRDPSPGVVDKEEGTARPLLSCLESPHQACSLARRPTVSRYLTRFFDEYAFRSSMTSARRIRLALVNIDSPQWMAGGVYLRNLVYALGSLPIHERPEIGLVGTSNPTSAIAKEIADAGLASEEAVTKVRRQRIAAILSRLGTGLRGVRRSGHALSNAGRFDILYPAGFGVTVPGTVPLFWIADFQHVHLPRLFAPSEIDARQRGAAEISRQDAILVLSSRSALRDFRPLFPDARVRPRIWSFCSSFGPAEAGGANPRQAYGLPAKFLYVPNQFWMHKDHLTVFKALTIVTRKGIRPPIVCTGLEQDYREP